MEHEQSGAPAPSNEHGEGHGIEAPSPAPRATDGAGDWRAAITDRKARDFAARFASPAEVVSTALDLRGKLSRAIVPPDEGASREELADFHRKLGVPESPDDYGLDKPEDWPEDVPYDEALRDQAAEAFRELGIPIDAACGLHDWYNRIALAQMQQLATTHREAMDRAEATLRREWGHDYERELGHANRAFREFVGEDGEAVRQLTLRDGTLLGSHPAIIRAFAEIGRRVSEASGPFGDHQDGDARSMNARLDDLTRKGLDNLTDAERREKRALFVRKFGTEPADGRIR